MSAAPTPLDRRQRRRLETVEEVLDIALDIMGEQGVAGLSVGEVARRMGIRPPSLYVYFPSKNALYDALFARGARSLLTAMQQVFASSPRAAQSAEARLLDLGQAFARWSVEHQAYSQLLFWRPVPGFVPSKEAYAPAVELFAHATQQIVDLQQRGLLRDDVPADDIQRDWTILIAGVVSQQLSNAPEESFADGRFSQAIPGLVRMFASHYATPRRSTRRTSHVNKH